MAAIRMSLASANAAPATHADRKGRLEWHISAYRGRRGPEVIASEGVADGSIFSTCLGFGAPGMSDRRITEPLGGKALTAKAIADAADRLLAAMVAGGHIASHPGMATIRAAIQ